MSMKSPHQTRMNEWRALVYHTLETPCPLTSPIKLGLLSEEMPFKNTLIMGRKVQNKHALDYWLFIRPHMTVVSTISTRKPFYYWTTKTNLVSGNNFHETQIHTLMPSSLMWHQLRVLPFSWDYRILLLPCSRKAKVQEAQLRRELRIPAQFHLSPEKKMRGRITNQTKDYDLSGQG